MNSKQQAGKRVTKRTHLIKVKKKGQELAKKKKKREREKRQLPQANQLLRKLLAQVEEDYPAEHMSFCLCNCLEDVRKHLRENSFNSKPAYQKLEGIVN